MSLLTQLFLGAQSSVPTTPLLRVVVTIIVLAIFAAILVPICIFFPKARKILWLLLLSQIPLLILSFYQWLNISVLGKAVAFGWPVIILESIVWIALTAGLVWLAYRAARKYNVIPPFSWKYFRWGRMLIGGVLLIGSQYLLAALFSVIFGPSGNQTTSNQASLNSLAVQVPFLLFFLATVLAGFFEELLFRVGSFEILLPKHKNWAFLVSAFTFALAHISAGPLWGTNEALQSWIIYGTMALILTGFYYKYRNFYLNMSIHMTLNIIASGLFWLQLIGIIH